MATPNSIVVYDGPSRIDGKPIVVILTGLADSSENSKTGNLVQSFIIRADVDPTDALKTGDDASVCGLCPHRPLIARMLERAGVPTAPCYVNVGHSVLAVWGAYRRGSYPKASSIDQVAQLLKGRKLRLGTYGDPAAAPVALWQLLVSLAADHVGYTHQWQAVGFDAAAWSPLVMASADNESEALQAQKMGMRYFRVSIGVDRKPLEVSCPASAEGGRKAQCSDCMLCAGTSKQARSIVIADHGPGHQKRIIHLLTEKQNREKQALALAMIQAGVRG
jgi:hypothetical protein